MTDSLLNVSDIGSLGRSQLEDSIRARSRTLYLGENLALSRILGRYKFYVDTRDVGFASHIMLDGYWEMWLTQFMARHVKPGMNVIDIGANFGYYSLLLSDLVSETGRSLCIEANPVVAEKLEWSLSINGFGPRSTVAACAAGDGSESSVTFFVPHREPKNARIISASDPVDPLYGRAIEVPCKTVDVLTADMGRIDFIKIDAEGAEPLILRGMTGLLARDKPDMILEFNYLRYSEPQQFIQQIAAYYPVFRYLDFDGSIKDLAVERLATEQLGEDWLLFLSNRM